MHEQAKNAQHVQSHPGAPADAADPQPPAVRLARPQESGALKVALAAAFFDDPVFGWLIGPGSSRMARMQRYFAIQLAHTFVEGCVWTSDGSQGAALCMPPGKWRLPALLMLTNGPQFTSVFRARLPRALGMLTAIERRHLRGPHHYFANIGVTPAAQGKGLGRTLMRPTLDRCDEEGLPAYLEASSERNAALYERLGFECVEVLRFAGSPPLRLMTRQPR
jgi:ribosomal protein S18 acetylase RimI-like enzyme